MKGVFWTSQVAVFKLGHNICLITVLLSNKQMLQKVCCCVVSTKVPAPCRIRFVHVFIYMCLGQTQLILKKQTICLRKKNKKVFMWEQSRTALIRLHNYVGTKSLQATALIDSSTT